MIHHQGNNKSIYTIVPLIGMGPFRLGDSETQVRQTLADLHMPLEQPHDPFFWELREPYLALAFSNEPERRLVQIITESKEIRVAGRPILGLRLHEALLELGVQRFDDTQWSLVSSDSSFCKGELVAEPKLKGPPRPADLILSGTLWIKSLGLGLELHKGCVNSVLVRQLENLPQKGFGPVAEQHILDAGDSEAVESTYQALPSYTARRKPMDRFRLVLWLATCITLGVLSWVVTTMVGDYLAWARAIEVTGKVVALSPEGPFPDQLVVEYPMPNEELGRATVPSQYATAREIGQDVELVYRETDPSYAMTRLQSRDHFSSLSISWLYYLIPLFGLEISLLFPNFNRRRR